MLLSMTSLTITRWSDILYFQSIYQPKEHPLLHFHCHFQSRYLTVRMLPEDNMGLPPPCRILFQLLHWINLLKWLHWVRQFCTSFDMVFHGLMFWSNVISNPTVKWKFHPSRNKKFTKNCHVKNLKLNAMVGCSS